MEKLIGKKLYMTSVFDEGRKMVPVTVLEVGPCKVTQIKSAEKEGYTAVQIGYGKTREKRLNKPIMGHIQKAGVEPVSKMIEFRTDQVDNYKPGDELTVEIFKIGEFVDVSGLSKGKGFAGVVKRHGFGGGPKTHGQSDRLRTGGSIGAASDPSRVFKGMRMPGRMGGKRNTVRNLEVINIDKEKNLLIVKGAVPGARNSIIEVARG